MKDHTVKVDFSPEEIQFLQNYAKSKQMTLEEFIVQAAYEKIREDMENGLFPKEIVS